MDYRSFILPQKLGNNQRSSLVRINVHQRNLKYMYMNNKKVTTASISVISKRLIIKNNNHTTNDYKDQKGEGCKINVQHAKAAATNATTAETSIHRVRW